jgi:ABC-type multidrug transport system ATPase subunit
MLLARSRRSDLRLQSGTEYRIGRDPSADICLADARVSWEHAILRTENGIWVLNDAGSTNGTFRESDRITRLTIEGPLVLRFGNSEDGALLRLEPEAAPVARPEAQLPWLESVPSVDRRPSVRMPLPVQVMRIGRTPDNDLAVEDLSVSRRHAELRKSPSGRYEIIDLDSHNGTFLNGVRVHRAEIGADDIIGIGHATFRLADGELREYVDTGDITFEARSLRVEVGGGKVLLDDVTFPIPERCFVGVIGPSGAGKSTLLNALTGMRPATAGSVLYDNRDLYRHYPELRHRIGLVPQQEIMHTQLTARRSLSYTAELRFPADTGKSERTRRVTEVLGELGLDRHADTRADSLSGGQLKRVSVALELLTRPSLLFLDEPTSGLDPGREKALMEQMRDLAHSSATPGQGGRTILVVTHSMLNLDTCDRLLVLVPGGRIAYYGPPAEGLKFFGQTRWDVVFEEFEKQPDRDWAADFRRSSDYLRYVAGPMGFAVATSDGTVPMVGNAPVPGAAAAPDQRPTRSRGGLRQLSTLARRYLRVIAADRFYLGTLVAIPLILGGVVRLMPAPHGLSGAIIPNAPGQQLLMILMIMAALAGIVNAVRELVKENAIYIRERAAGLSAGAYLMSKALVQGVICLLQAAAMTLVGLYGRPLPATGSALGHLPLVELMAGVAGLEIASMCLGLLVSTIMSSSDKAMQAIVPVTMVQFVFSGGLFSVAGTMVVNQVSWLFPARWGMAALASTSSLNRIDRDPTQAFDTTWNHNGPTWALDMALLLALGVVYLLLSWRRLARRAPGRRASGRRR